MNNFQKPTIEMLTEKTKLSAGVSQTVDLLVCITPPSLEQTGIQRAPLNLSIVLDHSGSMSGHKIREAKEAAKACVDRLMSADRFSTVIFDDEVEVLIPSQLVSDRYMMKRAISSIEANGSTALHEAWVKGGLQVSEYLDAHSVNRVLLITDGQANVGETRVDKILSHVRELAQEGVSTSTIGIGEDFNEDLLMPMAEEGNGNAWHVKESQDVSRIFETEVASLLRQSGHNVTLKITPGSGIVLSDLLNDFDQVGGRYQLPNLLAGDPVRLIVRLSVPAHAEGESTELVSIDLRYTDQRSGQTIEITESFTSFFASADEVNALTINSGVVAASTLLMNARARREAIQYLDADDGEAALVTLKCVADNTSVAYSKAPSPELAEENIDLAEVQFSIASEPGSKSSRKALAYRRESLRKSR